MKPPKAEKANKKDNDPLMQLTLEEVIARLQILEPTKESFFTPKEELIRVMGINGFAGKNWMHTLNSYDNELKHSAEEMWRIREQHEASPFFRYTIHELMTRITANIEYFIARRNANYNPRDLGEHVDGYFLDEYGNVRLYHIETEAERLVRLRTRLRQASRKIELQKTRSARQVEAAKKQIETLESQMAALKAKKLKLQKLKDES